MLIICIVLTILAVIVAIISNNQNFGGFLFFSLPGAICLGIADVIMIIWIISIYSNGFAINDKIKMYQEENKDIQEQITIIVNNYQQYEKEVVDSIADMEVLMIKFPELKTSELVKTQMNIYIENNAKIKKLKEQKIDIKLGKWLLYFGE